MKTYLFLLFFIVASTVNADNKLVIDKLIYSTSDLSGSTKPRLDANGKACALLKISSLSNLTFEGNIVGDVSKISGEYWVYITEGSYLLTIKSEGKEPLLLNFRDYNINKALSKATYHLTFYARSYKKIRDYDLISGPRLRKYSPTLFESPFKNDAVKMAQYLKDHGDGFEESITCSVVGIKEDGQIVRYAVIYDSSDREDDAILVCAIEDGPFAPKIYILEE